MNAISRLFVQLARRDESPDGITAGLTKGMTKLDAFAASRSGGSRDLMLTVQNRMCESYAGGIR